jgi:hypothetical protein
MDLMELLGDMCHVESFFDPFGDNVSVDAKYLLDCVKRAIGVKAQVDARLGPFKDSANLDTT